MSFEFKEFLELFHEIIHNEENEQDNKEKVIIYNNGIDKIFANHKKRIMEILLGYDNSPFAQTYNTILRMFPEDRAALYLLNSMIVEKKYLESQCKEFDIGCLICQQSFCIGCFENHANNCIDHCKDCGILLSAKKTFS